jgi:hypothetical protein
MTRPLTARRWAWTIGALAMVTLVVSALGVSIGSQGVASRFVRGEATLGARF